MALALVLSVLVGLALGLLGGGGSVLLMPILTYAGHLEPKLAITSSLLVIAVTSAAALAVRLKSGAVCFKTGLTFGVAGMAGAYLGGHLSRHIPTAFVLLAFGALMLATGFAMLRARPAEAASTVPVNGAQRALGVALRGSLVGLLTGVLGAGGGFLVVPALVLWGRMPMTRAVATSLLVIGMQASAGFLGHLSHTAVPWSVVVPITSLSAVGGILGSALTKLAPQALLRRGFAWVVLGVGALMVGRQVPSDLAGGALYRALFVEIWPWWMGGLAIASIVLGLLLVDSRQLGVSTGCSEICRLPMSREARASWRPRFLLGIVLGGLLATLLARTSPTLSMGSLDARLPSLAPRLTVLFGAGLLLGGGARLAGGCTSGHAIVGTALGARSSLLATALFMLAGFFTTQLLFHSRGGF